MMTSVTRLIVAGTAAIAVGACSTSELSVDQFSRAYTEFRDRATEMDTCARLPMERDSLFWTSLVEAVNTQTSDASRAAGAVAALAAYRSEVAPVMLVCAEYVQNMDVSVVSLVETANRIKTDRIRSEAVEIARLARALQIAYSSLMPLYERRFTLQTTMLNDEVRVSGVLSHVPIFAQRAQEVAGLVKESDQRWTEAAAAWRSTQDAFAALKGQTGLKTYPGKLDAEPTKAPK